MQSHACIFFLHADFARGVDLKLAKNADVTIFCNNTESKMNTTIACQMAGRGARDQSDPISTIIWAPQQGKGYIDEGNTLLELNDEKNLDQTILFLKAMYFRWENLLQNHKHLIAKSFADDKWRNGFEGLTND